MVAAGCLLRLSRLHLQSVAGRACACIARVFASIRVLVGVWCGVVLKAKCGWCW